MMSPVERDFARRLHAAAIAEGKAKAALERLPADIPKCLRMMALIRCVQAGAMWMRVYYEIIAHFQAERAAQGTEAQRAMTVKQGMVHDGPVGNADAPKPYGISGEDE